MNMGMKESELLRIIEAFPLGVMIFDSQMHLKLWNEKSLQLTGIGIEDILSGDIRGLINKKVMEMIEEPKITASSSTQSVITEQAGKSLRYTVSSISENEDEIYKLLLIEDSTMLTAMEGIKRDFIVTLLHKLRGPLCTLKTSLSMLKSGIIKGGSFDVEEIIEIGYHEVQRLVDLLNDMRDLFLIETGLAEKDLEIENFSLASALERAVETLSKMLPPFDSVKKRLIIKGDLNIVIESDFEKIEKVFFILLKNALMYSDENSEVTVSFRSDEDSVDVSIEDRGIGVSVQNQPLLFSKYFRENNEKVRSHDGNGIGLFIAKSFVELLKGTIYCESIQAKGSVFTFSLPRKTGR